MKTQIVTLESHDDLISVRDRLSWAKTPRILLVWPKYEKITLRQVDLKILQRHAVSLGAQLGLVTRRRRVRADAEALGIPVFVSTGQAQRLPWPNPRRRRWPRRAPRKELLQQRREQARVPEEAWRTNPVIRVGAFAVGVFSVLVLAALFIPRAQISLQPESKVQSVVLPVSASTDLESVFITGSIPARELHAVVEGEETIRVTGEGIVPQSKARGVALFRNLTQQEVTIPAGTVVQSTEPERVRFVTTRTGTVDAGVGETIELPIEAVEGGLAGNLEAELVNAIEGRLGLLLAVTNPEPLTGGRERASVQASNADRRRVKNLLMDSLETQAYEQLSEQIGSGDVLFEDTFEVSQILSEDYDPPAGTVGTALTLKLQVEYSVLYASAADLSQLAALALNASLPSGFSPASDTITVKPVTQPQRNENGSTRWTVRAERQIVQQIHAGQVTQLVQGLGSQNAQIQLERNLPLADSPRVDLTPSWWPWVPIVPFRISVVTR
jgi:hypothetical protein